MGNCQTAAAAASASLAAPGPACLSLSLTLPLFPPPPLHTHSLFYSPFPLTLSPPPKTLLLNTLPPSFSPFLLRALSLSLSLFLCSISPFLSRCTRVQRAAGIHSVELISQLRCYNHQLHHKLLLGGEVSLANRKQTSWSLGHK